MQFFLLMMNSVTVYRPDFQMKHLKHWEARELIFRYMHTYSEIQYSDHRNVENRSVPVFVDKLLFFTCYFFTFQIHFSTLYSQPELMCFPQLLKTVEN